jgi:hypothetical protein
MVTADSGAHAVYCTAGQLRLMLEAYAADNGGMLPRAGARGGAAPASVVLPEGWTLPYRHLLDPSPAGEPSSSSSSGQESSGTGDGQAHRTP